MGSRPGSNQRSNPRAKKKVLIYFGHGTITTGGFEVVVNLIEDGYIHF